MFKHILTLNLIIFSANLAVAETLKNKDTVIKYKNAVNTDGTYGFDFAQSNGLEFREVGLGGHYAKGAYKYVFPEGRTISVIYSADETGFHPESESIPTAPPIPAYILKSLKYIQEHAPVKKLATEAKKESEASLSAIET